MRSRKLVFGEPFRTEWIDVDVPDPGPGEIVVRTRKTLISTGTELTAYTGDFLPDSVWAGYIQYPWPDAGYSNVGDMA